MQPLLVAAALLVDLVVISPPLINGPKTKAPGPTVTILFIRHASSVGDSPDPGKDLAQGWSNPPLNEKGRHDAVALAKKVAEEKPDLLVSSDLRRAAETAMIIQKHTRIPVVETSWFLRSWDIGGFEGRLNKDVNPILVKMADNSPDRRPPAGKTPGESYDEYNQRFRHGLKLIIAKYQNKCIGIVSHARNERYLAASEKANWVPGTIDIQEFGRKGPSPSTVGRFEIPLKWL